MKYALWIKGIGYLTASLIWANDPAAAKVWHADDAAALKERYPQAVLLNR